MKKLLFLSVLPLLSCGCVAFDVGRPEPVETFEYKSETISLGEAPRKAISAAPAVRQEPPAAASHAGRVFVGLEGRVLRTDKWGDVYRNVDLLRQRRMAFGFVPGAAEGDPMGYRLLGKRFRFCGSEGHAPLMQDEEGRFRFLPLFFGAYLATPYALVIEPFVGRWECSGHAQCPREWPNGATRDPISKSDWIRTDLYAQFEECISSRIGTASYGGIWLHMPLFGFHRFVRYSWGEPTDSRIAERTTTSEEGAFGRGPFMVELEVPDIGFREKAMVPAGAREAAFALPFADADRNASATVRFSPVASRAAEPADDATRALLAGVRGADCAVKVRLRAPPPGLAAPARPDAGAAGVVTQVVARVAPAVPYRIAKSRGADGSPVWRVTVLDEAKTGLEIAALVRPKILAELREGYLAKHPSAAAEDVRAAAQYETAEDGRTLVYTGAAFEWRAVVDGWTYDEATRRGSIRLCAPEDVPADLLHRWTKENVAEIVRDKNVALAAGSAAPPGARFRLLSESLENGILAVEFEAVE